VVSHKESKAISGVTISVLNQYVQTEADGTFDFYTERTNVYAIKFSHEGFKQIDTNVSRNNRETIDLSIVLDEDAK